jgi:pimeloyl-ACP methyl ester carboxylesterase
VSVRARSLPALLRHRRPAGPAATVYPPAPPVDLPPGRIVHVPGRGEFLLRDGGGDGPAVLLLHGWMVSADLNWVTMYGPLQEAGYRILALDHRGHGRGLRSPEPFRLSACADDAAAVAAVEGIASALVVGYSMGGPIACLLARDHPELVRGLVLCATAPDWQEPHMRRAWRAMALLRLQLGLFGDHVWRSWLRNLGLPDSPGTSWAAAELTRGSSRDIAEAGRELGRFDGRSWLGALRPPTAVIVTADDELVPPRKQRELAALLGAPVHEVPGSHTTITFRAERFAAALLGALDEVGAPASLQGR